MGRVFGGIGEVEALPGVLPLVGVIVAPLEAAAAAAALELPPPEVGAAPPPEDSIEEPPADARLLPLSSKGNKILSRQSQESQYAHAVSRA